MYWQAASLPSSFLRLAAPLLLVVAVGACGKSTEPSGSVTIAAVKPDEGAKAPSVKASAEPAPEPRSENIACMQFVAAYNKLASPGKSEESLAKLLARRGKKDAAECERRKLSFPAEWEACARCITGPAKADEFAMEHKNRCDLSGCARLEALAAKRR